MALWSHISGTNINGFKQLEVRVFHNETQIRVTGKEQNERVVLAEINVRNADLKPVLEIVKSNT